MVFNRFAREARESVEQAVEEARLMGHDSVGDEDLLLGILSADEGVASQALASLGVTLELVREKSEVGLRRISGQVFTTRRRLLSMLLCSSRCRNRRSV